MHVEFKFSNTEIRSILIEAIESKLGHKIPPGDARLFMTANDQLCKGSVVRLCGDDAVDTEIDSGKASLSITVHWYVLFDATATGPNSTGGVK